LRFINARFVREKGGGGESRGVLYIYEKIIVKNDKIIKC
jgi:hypothetical protein